MAYIAYDNTSLLLLLRHGSAQAAERGPLRFCDLSFPPVRWAVVDGHERWLADTTSHFSAITEEVIVARIITREGWEEESGLSVCTREQLVKHKHVAASKNTLPASLPKTAAHHVVSGCVQPAGHGIWV